MSDAEPTTADAVPKQKAAPKRYACFYEGCEKVFNKPWKLDRHVCYHTKEVSDVTDEKQQSDSQATSQNPESSLQRPFKCNYPNCTKDYTCKAHLQRHICVSHLKKNNAPTSILICPYPGCLRDFQNKYSLKKHFKTHYIEKTYKCGKCEAVFKKRGQLFMHGFEHRGKSIYPCTECDKRFLTEKALEYHQKKHKPYVCEYEDCKEELPTWTQLRKHFKLKHTRFYICDFCNRSYINKNTLAKHIIVHLDKSKRDVFLCPYLGCDKYYLYERNLKHHIKSAHEGFRFKCPVENCNKEFREKCNLVAHQLRHGRTVETPRTVATGDDRKRRKDKGLPTKSMTSLLSGIPLPFAVDKSIAQNTVTPEIDEQIDQTLQDYRDAIRELEEAEKEDEQESPSTAPTEKTEENDPSLSIMYFSVPIFQRKKKPIRRK